MRGARQQRGAAAMFAALGLVAVVAASALAIDLGQIYLAQRDLQRVANTAVLDAVTAAAGCTDAPANRLANANSHALASLGRNGGESTWLTEGGRLQLGHEFHDGAMRNFAPLGDPRAARAIQIALQRPFPRRIFNLPGVDSTAPMRVVAAAKQSPVASFNVNSQVVELDPTEVEVLNQVLSAVLGEPLALSPEGVNGLISTLVPVGDLIPGGIGPDSIEEFEDTEITVVGLIEQILSSPVAQAAAVVDALQEIASSSEGLNSIIPGDIISIPEDYDDVGQATVPAFELIRAALQLAGNSVFDLTPGATIVIPGDDPIVTAGLPFPPRFIVGEPEEINDSQTIARSAQGFVDISLSPGNALGAPLRLKTRLEIAPSEATLLQIYCASRDRRQNGVDVGVVTGLTSLRILDDEPVLEATVPVNLGPPGLSFDIAIRVTARSSVEVSDPTSRVLRFVGPFARDNNGRPVPENSQSVGSSSANAVRTALLDLGDALEFDLEIDVAGVPPPFRDTARSLVTGIVNSTVLPQIQALIGPILVELEVPLEQITRAAGLRVPSATVTVYDVYVPRPSLIAQR